MASPSTRTSSNRALASDLEKYEHARWKLDNQIKKARSQIKPEASFDGYYWQSHKNVSELSLERHEIIRKIAITEFKMDGGKDDDWESSQEAALLRETKSSLEMRSRVFSDQMARLGFWSKDDDQAHRQWVMELLTTAPMAKGGLGAAASVDGPRDASEQSKFRNGLIDVCNARHPDEFTDRLWCPILGAYLDSSNLTAAHIFPYAAGQVAMTQLFGLPDGVDELMAPANGLLIATKADEMIGKGWMTIVPDLPTNATHQEVDAWVKADIKEYKIRVLNSNPRDMKMKLPLGAPPHPQTGRQKHWWDLDGERLVFKSDFRPRARYLYWSFAVALLRNAYQSKQSVRNPLTEQFGKRFWGTTGRWIRRKYLRGFVEHLGHEINWENLMEAAMDDEGDGDEVDPAGVLEADKQLEVTRHRIEKGWPTEEEEAEEIEEEDEEQDDSDDED
ncbi:MAG: hypothetical protein Q9201_000086 [Fulgogasparrea decipioides]